MRDVFYPVLMSVTEGYDECITLGITRFTDFANRIALRETQYFGKWDVSAQKLFLEHQTIDEVQKTNNPKFLNALFTFGVY